MWRFWRWRRIAPDRAGRCRACAEPLEVCEIAQHDRLNYVHCFLKVSCPTHGQNWF